MSDRIERAGAAGPAVTHLCLATVLLSAAVTVPQAHAQAPAEGDAGGLEEITVTARRFAESLQESPVAVSAFSQASLEARGIADLEDVGRLVPNMQFFPSSVAGSGSGQPFIRGVGQFDFLLTTDPGVGIYVDGVYLARSLGNLLDLVDIERVEVLRGPQGTLYGKNTIGGAINVVTRKPGGELEGFAEARVGSHERFDLRAGLSMPMADDRLALRVAASSRKADGFGHRVPTGERMGGEDSTAVQAAIDWRPTDRFDLTLAFDRTKVDQDFSVAHVVQTNPAAPLQQLYNALAAPYDDRYVLADPYTSAATGLNFSEQEIWGLSATLVWRFDNVTLKSITGYRDQQQQFGTDPDGSPETLVDEHDTTDQKQFSEELQASGTGLDGRLRWVAGLYFMKEDADGIVDVTLFPRLFTALESLPGALIPLAPGVTCPPPSGVFLPCVGGAGNPLNGIFDLSRVITLDQTTKSRAAYGQASFNVAGPLSLTYGIRYTREKKDFFTSLRLTNSGAFPIPPTNREESWNDVSHRFGAEYRVSDDVLIYASAAKGFKSGGFNGRGSTANEVNAYDPEKIWSYEVGLKSEWLDRRLRINASAFYNDYTDLQFTTQAVATDGTQAVLVGNAAKAEIKGFELEIAARPAAPLQLSASLGYLESEYTDIDPTAQTITLASKLIGAPRWTAAFTGDYTVAVGDHLELVLRSDYTYRSKTYFDAANTESIAQGGFGIWNAGVTLQSATQRWAVTAGVQNLTDKAYRVSGVGVLDSLGFASAIYGRPREWFAQATLRL